MRISHLVLAKGAFFNLFSIESTNGASSQRSEIASTVLMNHEGEPNGSVYLHSVGKTGIEVSPIIISDKSPNLNV
ncbi:hypothetical protein K4G60_g3684 [Candida parapsilosis]|nr:hypothetical protein K4G60_g3684 [Candida parapsilosis]KAI5909268.1 hypothetical protein K4G61_g2956 [Candida parapsilosis]